MKIKLTAENVDRIINDCLFKEGEATEGAVIVEGIISKFGFHPARLAAHKSEIGEMLEQLPDQFDSTKGGGWSFLNACITKGDQQWGEHRSIEALLVLGMATGQAKILVPREMWSAFPGGMPYFSFTRCREIEAAPAQ